MSDAKEVALNIWKDVAPEIPGIIINSVTASTEVALQGEFKDKVQEILEKMKDDLVAFKNKEIDRIEFEDLVQRRKAAIFALYNANRITYQRPAVQKILTAVENIATVLLLRAIPEIIKATV